MRVRAACRLTARHGSTRRPYGQWVDYNGHMNVAYYVLIFDHATDATLDRLDVGEAYRRRAGCSVFVGEMHVNYRQEVLRGRACDRYTLLAFDERRLVLFHEMTCTFRKAGRQQRGVVRARRSGNTPPGVLACGGGREACARARRPVARAAAEAGRTEYPSCGWLGSQPEFWPFNPRVVLSIGTPANRPLCR